MMLTTALDLAVRAAIVLALAWLAVALLRRQAASRRALVWTIAFGSLLALPLLAWLMPEWRVALWQEPVTVHVVNVRSEEPPRTFHVAISPADAPRLPVSQVFVSDADAVSPIAPAAPAQPTDWGRLALMLFALVTVLLLVRIAASHARISRLLARTAPAGTSWKDLIDEVRAARGIRRSVAVRVSDAVSVPAISGVFRPTLLLPAEAGEWDGPLRRAVVVHELAHVARWDALAQLVEQIACAMYWFIPLVWHGARRAAALRERASDDEVIRAGIPATAYAERLLDLVRAAGAPAHHLATLAMARPSRMRERVTALLDPVARREALTMRMVVAAVALSSCVVAAIAAAAPSPSGTLILNPAAMAVPAPVRVPNAIPDAVSAAPAEASAAGPVAETEALAGGPEQTRKVEARLGPCDPNAQTRQHLVGTVNGRRTLRIEMEGGGCKIDLKSEGRITFTDDFTDIAVLEDRGFFRLLVEDGGTRRELDIDSRDGRLTRTWRVNGRELPYDEAARRWFASFLIDLDRRSAIGVDVRLPYLMRQGGVRAVLAETGQMSSDHARGVYYKALNDTARLSPADVTRILQQAAQMTESDHYAHEVIRMMAPHGIGDAAQRAAVTGLIGTMDSDHYIAGSVEALVATGRPSAGEMDFLVRVLGRMKSDHYKTQVLTKVLNGATLTAEQQAQLAKAAANIDSDHYASQFLRAVLRARGAGAAVRRAALDSALTIQSDHYRTEVLSVLLEDREVSEGELLRVVELVKPMSDHYEAEMLRKTVRHRSATERVRQAAADSAAGLSQHYRDEVLRAAGKAR
jgi:beta-lactamase regulating signal transducer with metallopeptidase domain